MIESNPEIGQMLNNPAMLRQMMETMRNPVRGEGGGEGDDVLHISAMASQSLATVHGADASDGPAAPLALTKTHLLPGLTPPFSPPSFFRA